MERTRRKSRKGFSLLDVMFASLLFGTIALGLNQVMQSYSRATAKGRSLLVATQLAERVMERQLALGFNAVDLPQSPTRVFDVVQTSYGTEHEIQYWYAVDVTDLSDTSNDLNIGLREIRVTVGWHETNIDRELTVSSMVYWDG